MLGRTLSHYLILEKIGAGGMGVVYRARDTQLERVVALKVVSETARLDATARARLLREARTASALNHPNICTIHDAGEADGETFVAMEMVEGRSLSDLISSDGLPVETAVRYAVQIADALAHAHERGVVHRDLKSANVVITPEGRPKVLDFGLAKRVFTASEETATRTSGDLTEPGTVAGTLSHMAPELLHGEPADARSDLWALGVLLYHSVSGRLPFSGATSFQVTSAVLRDSPSTLPPRVPAPLAAIILRLLSKPPGERYQRAGEVRAALETMQSGAIASGAIAANISQKDAPAIRAPRMRWLWAAGAIVLVIGGAAWFAADRRRTASPSDGPRLTDGSRPSQNSSANEYYEKALLFGGGGPRQDVAQERRMLERALDLDPKFAAARAEYAFTSVVTILRGDSNDQAWLYKGEEESRKALADDPACGRAHSVLALTYLLRGRKDLVSAEVDKAMRANPNDPTPHSELIFYHEMNGDYPEAIQEAQRMIKRWPLYWPGQSALGAMLHEQGDLAGAIQADERILEQDPKNLQALTWLARVHMELGDLSKARQALERARPEDRKNFRLRQHWALLLALEGKKPEAVLEMDSDVQTYASIYFRGPLLAAEYYAVMGDTPSAFEWLDRAGRIGDDREGWLRRDSLLANIRDQPRFQQVLASMAYRRSQRPSR